MMVNILQNKMPLFPYFNLNFQMFAAHQHQQQMENAEMHDNKADENDTNYVEYSPEKKIQLRPSNRTKRKGKAFKLEEKMNHYDDTEENLVNESATTSKVIDTESSNSKVTSSVNATNAIDPTDKIADYECKFCGIIFKDNVLFNLHIGYHSLGDEPFRCNNCGTKTEDKVQFFLHIAKFPHS